jgi:hypothetical protein
MPASRVDVAAPRFPGVPEARGHYESYYVIAHDPAGGRAVWVRHTVLKRPGAAARGTLWLTAFTAGRGAVQARETVDEALGAGPPWMATGAAGHAGPGGVRATLADASWDLTLRDGAQALPYLPAERLYDAAVPRTKGVALHPRVLVDGAVQAGGERWELSGWEGVLGHNWGAEHAEHWVYLHAALPGGDWVDLALARTRLGPVLAPWLGGGAVCLDGERHVLDGLPRRPKVAVSANAVSVGARCGGSPLDLRAWADDAETARWDYASPSGASRAVTNCSIASMELTLGDRAVRVDGPAALELGRPARA